MQYDGFSYSRQKNTLFLLKLSKILLTYLRFSCIIVILNQGLIICIISEFKGAVLCI